MISEVTTQQSDILEKPIYLLDQNMVLYAGTRPSKLFLDLSEVLPIDSKDADVLDYATRNNLTIVTGDIKFASDILLKSNNVIFQTNNRRFYLRVKELKQIQLPKKNTITKILGSINPRDKKRYIVDYDKLYQQLSDYDVGCSHSTIRYYSVFDYAERINIILHSIKKSKSTLVTNSHKNFIDALIELNECVIGNDTSVFHHISVECFEFEVVVYDKRLLALKNNYRKKHDILQENIRLARKNIDEITRNLNFVECELIRRKDIGVSEETPVNQLSGQPKGD